MKVTAIAPWFLAKVNRNPTTGCWEWLFAKNDKGYGRTMIPKTRKTVFSHRLAYEIFVAPIPIGMCVLHRCDNSSCCNPAHLFLGDRADNNRDMCRKGRHRPGGSKKGKAKCNYERGSSHHNALLNEQTVAEIRDQYSIGCMSYASLADRFGVASQTIGKIIRRELWAHV